MAHTCPGCKGCIEGRIPDFNTDEEEEAFWDTHDAALFPRKKVHFAMRGRPKEPVTRIRVSIMLFPGLKEKLEALATRKGIGYQTLIQQYLTDRVEAELRGT